jgi:DNA-directed RNA polymerase subunit RPC12/RpoP
MQTDPASSAFRAGRWIGAVAGFAFCGIGLTVLGFLWLSPFGEWNSPPLIFRIFGSFIAVVFVFLGGGAGIASLRGGMGSASVSSGVPPMNAAASYHCPQCGAPLADHSSVSPKGDVKCSFCNAWFSIYQREASQP